jgi:ParB family transcriptional regulator, chromosome partitioning protein
MRFKAKTVSIDSIDIENTSFKISTPKPTEDLIHSIGQFGLLSPPILKDSHDGYIIVSGFHRVNACKKIGWMVIDARVIEYNTKEIDCLKVSIADNIYHRDMNLIEQSIALAKLASFYDSENEFINASKQFGFGNNSSYINKLMNLHTLIPELQQSILSGTIPMTIAIEVSSFEKISMLPLIKLFERLKPTLNQQKEILTLIKEISKIRNSSIDKILKEKHILDIINHPDFGRTQKIKELRAFLQKIRFPVISNYYDQVNMLIRRLKLPNKLKLVPPENFEDVSYLMMLRFDSLPEFESYLNKLQNLSGTPEFRTLFNIDLAAQELLY